jgi:hypothetical protein
MISQEWARVLSAIAHNEVFETCRCRLLKQFHLLCKHYLRIICESGRVISLTFVHLRWWVAGPSITMRDWESTFAYTQPSIQATTDSPTSETNALALNPITVPPPTLTNYLSPGRLRIAIED